MSGMYQNEYEAWIVGTVYNFRPSMLLHRFHDPWPAKFEIKGQVGDENRCLTLCHCGDASNLLIKYKPAELVPPE
jgi:hypothetical protein